MFKETNRIMQEQLIAFETAKLAKEKGFIIYTPVKYDLQGEDESCDRNEFYHLVSKGSHYAKPTQSLLQKWLREVHNFHVEVQPQRGEILKWDYLIFDLKRKILLNDDEYFINTYEGALEAGLQEVLKLIKNEKGKI